MIVIYKTPNDKTSFDKHYFEVHVPLAKKLPGMIKYSVSKNPIIPITDDSDTYLIGTLYFDSLAAIRIAFESQEGLACAADRKILAPDEDKIQMYVFDTVDV